MNTQKKRPVGRPKVKPEEKKIAVTLMVKAKHAADLVRKFKELAKNYEQ